MYNVCLLMILYFLANNFWGKIWAVIFMKAQNLFMALVDL